MLQALLLEDQAPKDTAVLVQGRPGLRAYLWRQGLDVSEETLRKWDKAGVGPRYIRIGPRMLAYYIKDINEWLAAKRAASTPNPAA